KAQTARVSTEHPQEQIDLLKRERDEALEQQAATSEVLRVISRSPGDLQPVFDIIAASALRLCGSTWSAVLQFNGELIELAAVHNLDDFKGGETVRRSFPRKPSRTGVTDRAISTRTVTYIRDVLEIADYEHLDLARAAAFRSILSTPMLSKGQVVGAITVVGADANAFTDRHIDLLKTFADQAVIAIENVPLFEEVQARTRDLSESLEQQTATSKVLQVISSSPGELESVFDAMLANATRICEAKFGTLYLRDGDGFSAVAATRDAPPAYFEARKQAGVSPDGPIRRAATTKQVAHVTDIKEQQSYLDRHPSTVASVELRKFRTVLGVPMLKDDELIGVITLNRQEVRPFTNKQIELVKNFAAQAVIAIENTRLLNELRQRTDDLSESLQQQTATGEILTSISGSMTDAKPVFDAIVRNLLRLLGTGYAVVQLLQDGIIRLPAVDGEPGFEKLIDYYPRPLDGTTMGGLAMLSKQIVQFSPIIGNPAAPPATQKFASEFGFNSSLFAPMVRGDKV